LFPVENFEGRVGGFGFPFGLFGLIVGDSALLGADHGTIIDPTDGIDRADDFSIVKDDINVFIPFHGHVIHGNNHLLPIVSIEGLNFQNITGEMVYILLLTTMSKTTQITGTYHINIIV
jgi:hypothetical protein